MTHFESLYEIFTIVVRELIRSDVSMLTSASEPAKGQRVINSGEALKNKIDMIKQEEWKRVHGTGE